MRVTDNSTYRLMQSNLQRIDNDLINLRLQGVTGLKMNSPSDDPSAIRPVLETRTQLVQNSRYIETMGQSTDLMEATDGFLNQTENLLVRAKEIAINAVNGSYSNEDLQTLGDEVSELRNELLQTANAQVNGKYIFAGYNDQNAPFSENPAYDPALYDASDVTTWPVLYHGDHHPLELEITPGEFIESNLTGNALFLGITNAIAKEGYDNPYQGESFTSAELTPPAASDITITPAGGTPLTLSAATELVDNPGEHNYAGKLAGLFSQSGSGLIATANAAEADLGPLNLTGFVDGSSTYTLEIRSGGSTVSATLDGPSASYDYDLTGLAYALANTSGATNLTATSGTLANGVNYDISSGSLVLTGAEDGSEIGLSENIVGPGSGGVSSTATIYGSINVATNSETEVTIDDPGLEVLNSASSTLDGASDQVDMFTLLTQLEEGIRAGNMDNPAGPGGGVQSLIDKLEVAADQNRRLRSTLGSRAKRIENALEQQGNAQIDLTQILSRYEDADLISIYNDIIQKETAFESALSITGRISRLSILDYF